MDVDASTTGHSAGTTRGMEVDMLSWSIAFFIIALIAAIFGFSGIVASATAIAQLLFVGFLVLAVVSLALGRRLTT
jgi:uncharacterized membrane protein YtjA (UPF0391 family)